MSAFLRNLIYVNPNSTNICLNGLKYDFEALPDTIHGKTNTKDPGFREQNIIKPDFQ